MEAALCRSASVEIKRLVKLKHSLSRRSIVLKTSRSGPLNIWGANNDQVRDMRTDSNIEDREGCSLAA